MQQKWKPVHLLRQRGRPSEVWRTFRSPPRVPTRKRTRQLPRRPPQFWLRTQLASALDRRPDNSPQPTSRTGEVADQWCVQPPSWGANRRALGRATQTVSSGRGGRNARLTSSSYLENAACWVVHPISRSPDLPIGTYRLQAEFFRFSPSPTVLTLPSVPQYPGRLGPLRLRRTRAGALGPSPMQAESRGWRGRTCARNQ